jgi:hypothetical protein
MSILKPFRNAAIACVAVLALASAAHATIFNSFGTIVGSNATFTGGERDTWTTDPTPPSATWLFGTPVISGSGNNLNFTPNPALTAKPLAFSVSSPGPEQFEDGALSVTISPTSPTGKIALMSISEGGGYFLQNAGPSSSVAAALNILGLVITEVDNTPISGIAVNGLNFTQSFANVSGNGNFTILPTGIVYTGNNIPVATGIWSGNANFNVQAALDAALGTGHRATQLELELDNVLSTTSIPGASVAIDKKSFLIATSQNPVPEPASIVMGVLGGLGLATVSYRKKMAKKA